MKKILFLLLAISMISCYKKDIDALIKQVSILQTKVDSLTGALAYNTAVLQKRADSLSSALNLTNSNLNQTNLAIANTNKTLDSIKVQLGVINVQLTSLNKELAAESANIDSINSEINVLNKQYNDLVGRLNSLIRTSFVYSLRLNWNSMDTTSNLVYIMDSTKWHYVAVTIDNSREVKIYVDGVLGSNFYRANSAYVYSSLYLASSYYTSFTQYFKGSIDELRVSNIVRTQKEIQDYFNKAIGGILVYPNPIVPLPIQTLDNNTIGLWHFDETNGTSFANSVANKPAGVLYGGSNFVKGLSGNAINFDGRTGRGDCRMSLTPSPLTFEFWFKTNTLSTSSSIIQPYGMYNSDILLGLK
jgi:hypothetical protein